MAATNDDLAITSAWQDLVATYAGLASASCFVQNKSNGPVLVYFSSSSSPPSGGSGLELKADDVTYGTAAHVWVRSVGSSAVISSGLND